MKDDVEIKELSREQWKQIAVSMQDAFIALQQRNNTLVEAARDAENAMLALFGMVEPDNLTMQDIYRSCEGKHKRLRKALENEQ